LVDGISQRLPPLVRSLAKERKTMPPSPKAMRFRTTLVRPNARKKPGREPRLAELLLQHYEQGLPTHPQPLRVEGTFRESRG
jgi:hypothetical protein